MVRVHSVDPHHFLTACASSLVPPAPRLLVKAFELQPTLSHAAFVEYASLDPLGCSELTINNQAIEDVFCTQSHPAGGSRGHLYLEVICVLPSASA